ncbi:MAG: hypothetical protein IPH75_12100 [bacterium]|nr:hypothetical protein [bacterium]
MFRTSLSLAAAAFLLIFAGCSDSPTTPTNNTVGDVGGYTATNEAPAFNDPALVAATAEEVEYNDPVATTSSVQSLLSDPEAGIYHLRAVWGRLRYDSMSVTPTDWAGSLTISRGAELVRRVIRFEPATDSVLPRTDRRLIEWASTTTVHNDGLAFDLLIPPAVPDYDTTIQIIVDTLTGDTTEIIIVDTIPVGPVTVEFTAGNYSRTFSLNELATLDTIITFSDSTAIAFNGFKVERFACPRGFLAGFWGYDSTGQGEFRGMWISRHGVIEGHLRGTFGEDSTGAREFYGKWIDASGQFEGFLHGVWGQHANPHADSTAIRRAGGWFRGMILDANQAEIGVLAGHYFGSTSKRPGYFQGRWKVRCASMDGDDDGMNQQEIRAEVENRRGGGRK